MRERLSPWPSLAILHRARALPWRRNARETTPKPTTDLAAICSSLDYLLDYFIPVGNIWVRLACQAGERD